MHEELLVVVGQLAALVELGVDVDHAVHPEKEAMVVVDPLMFYPMK